MAYWTTVQVKTISPFELFPYPKIPSAKQTFSRQNIENERTELSPINEGVSQ
jgi:hypothetical protein